MRRLALFLAAFAYAVLLMLSVKAAVAWWQDEVALTSLDYALAIALPLLIWIWLRYLSIFRKGCGSAACALPEDRNDPPDSAR